MIRSLGIETVTVLIDRSLEEVIRVYPELNAIDRDGDEINLDALDDSYGGRSEEDVRAAFSALYAVMLLMLARMLGKEIALRLAGTTDARVVLEGNQLGSR